MFDRFTPGACQVLVLAQREALSLGHRHIGTEHVLLGLLGESGGVAAAVLRDAGVTPTRVRAAVERIVGRGEPEPDDAEALRSIGIDLDAVRARVEESFGPGALGFARGSERRRLRRRCEARPDQPPFTPRSKKVLELALRQSLALHHSYVGTEHILLGLLAEGEGVAAVILSAGIGLPEIRRRTLAAVGKVA